MLEESVYSIPDGDITAKIMALAPILGADSLEGFRGIAGLFTEISKEEYEAAVTS